MKKKYYNVLFLISALLILNSSFLIHNCLCQWQPDVRLTVASDTSFTSGNNAWCIAANGTFVHVVWWDKRDGNFEIYYKRSTDGGVSWGQDVRLTNNNANSGYPAITVSGSFVHIVWIDDRDGNAEIYYKRSTDNGISWGTGTRLTNSNYASWFPSVTVSGLFVHVVWRDDRDGNDEIYYKLSTDGGISWGADIRLTNNTAESYSPSVTSSGSFVHIVWSDERDNFNGEIYYKRSTDNGISWGTGTRLTNDLYVSCTPSVAVSGLFVHVVWIDLRDNINGEVYYKLSTDGGVSWGADTRLTNNPAYSSSPSVTASGSVVHVVWFDNRDGNREIYYKRSTDNGISWGQDTRLTNNPADSWGASVAVSSSTVHVVWTDYRDGNFEIYYKRDPTGNIGIKNISSEIPEKFQLFQNYPNPFNPMTKIRYEIPRNGFVKLIVYDVLGREVETLVNEKQSAGTYEAKFNASQYSSGVYSYRLITEGFSETKKMILIK